MKRKRVLAHLAIVALALVILGMARSQMPSDDPRAQQVRWDDPKLHNNPPFRQLKSRVERGQATERETRYFAWLLPRVYPFEKIPERAYKNARVQQDLFRESAVDPASLPSWAVTSTAWVPLGPRNIEGRVTAIALHPVDSGIIYAAGETGGIFKTADGGNTWMTATDELPDLIVQDIQFLPGNPDSHYNWRKITATGNAGGCTGSSSQQVPSTTGAFLDTAPRGSLVCAARAGSRLPAA